jgi:hypothetical protein
MSQVIRYFHIRTGTKGGATVKVVGDTDKVGYVDVQATFVSKRDNYVKALGRSFAEKAPVKVVPLRFLPRELGLIQDKANYPFRTDMSYAIKYFLPKT